MSSSRKPTQTVVFVGPPASGKTSLLRRYLDHNFNESHLPTGEIYSRNWVSGEQCVELRDTSGSSLKNNAIAIQKADLVVFVFDGSCADQFRKVCILMENLSEQRDNDGKPKFMLVANQADKRTGVANELLQSTIDKHGLTVWYGVSAKTGEGVDDLFTDILSVSSDLHSKMTPDAALRTSQTFFSCRSIDNLVGIESEYHTPRSDASSGPRHSRSNSE